MELSPVISLLRFWKLVTNKEPLINSGELSGMFPFMFQLDQNFFIYCSPQNTKNS